ncbi:uncharacterized protein LOC126795203 isoform X2 [Argentina anserina]|uniref:uncharacterized protein LOC126795203 isoform X2 n=1 Tax=Argentina anserina TaxID=57926 RepID=UPI0021768BC8|nr:uncharacterized protein LOC126795203 isoform X2 [Potentilla anserina]
MEPWEEQLDFDDDEDDAVLHLPSFSLRRCNHRASSSSLNPQPKPNSSSSPALIPGPAGAVQAAMHRRSQNSSGEPIQTQEVIRKAIEKGHEEDDDFTADSWLCALELAGGGGGARTPLGSIKKGLDTHRVAKVVAMIKSCTPNGLGDLMLTLKDPTGTVGATIHRRAISEGEFGKSISVGAVLVLQKVAVFSPSRSVCYLNVTLNNIVKVISKDSGSLATEDFPISSVNTPAPISEVSKMLRPPQETILPAQGSTQRIMNYLRQNSELIGSENTEKHNATGHTAPEIIFSGHAHSGSQFAAVEMKSSMVEKAMPNGITKMLVREDIMDTEQVTGIAEELRMAEEGTSSSISRCISGSANTVKIPDNHGRITGAKRHRQPLSLTTSVPDYTEEQLNLFDFD